jgi:hypothetical protein
LNRIYAEQVDFFQVLKDKDDGLEVVEGSKHIFLVMIIVELPFSQTALHSRSKWSFRQASEPASLPAMFVKTDV